MRTKLAILCIGVGVLLIIVDIQADGRQISLPDRRKSPAELRKLASKRDVTAIFLLGTKNDRASIPLLKRLAASPEPSSSDLDAPMSPEIRGWLISNYRESSFAAKAILTRMKAHDYLDEFIGELSTSNLFWKQHVMECLGYAGDKRAIKYLGPFLEDDVAPSAGPHSPGKTFSGVAAEALSEIIQPPFKEIHKERPGMPFLQYKEWKQWWKDNKDKYK